MSKISVHRRRVDANQKEIVDALLKVGCLVEVTAAIGRGFPDLVVASPYLGQILLLEVKDGSLVPSQRQLSDAQKIFHDKWKPYLVLVVDSVYTALRAVGVKFEEKTTDGHFGVK